MTTGGTAFAIKNNFRAMAGHYSVRIWLVTGVSIARFASSRSRPQIKLRVVGLEMNVFPALNPQLFLASARFPAHIARCETEIFRINR